MYETILVPTDGSAKFDHVLSHAIELADLADAKINAVYVDQSRNGGTEDDETPGQEALEFVESAASERDIPVVTTTLTGAPGDTILEHAKSADVDMIVMGTQGRSGINRFLLGSVAEKVIRQSEVPVVTVRLPGRARAVTSDDDAKEIAKQSLERSGVSVAGFPEDPYRETGTWVVRVETETGSVFNVHIDAETGETRIGEISD